VFEFVEGCFQFFAMCGFGDNTVKPHPLVGKRYRTPFRSQVFEFVEGCFQFFAMSGFGDNTVKPHPLVEDLVVPALRVRMPRAP
jgi:hypothetical protein